MIKGMPNNASYIWPGVVFRKEYSRVIRKPRMFVKVELPELSRVETELSDELRVTKDQERSTSKVGEVGSLVWIVFNHVLHEPLWISVLFDVWLLQSEHTWEGSDIEFEIGIHFFELPGSQVDFDHKMVQ